VALGSTRCTGVLCGVLSQLSADPALQKDFCTGATETDGRSCQRWTSPSILLVRPCGYQSTAPACDSSRLRLLDLPIGGRPAALFEKARYSLSLEDSRLQDMLALRPGSSASRSRAFVGRVLTVLDVGPLRSRSSARSSRPLRSSIRASPPAPRIPPHSLRWPRPRRAACCRPARCAGGFPPFLLVTPGWLPRPLRSPAPGPGAAARRLTSAGASALVRPAAKRGLARCARVVLRPPCSACKRAGALSLVPL